MKKLIIALYMLFVSSSISFANEIFSIHQNDWSLIIDHDIVFGLGVFIICLLFSILFYKYVSVGISKDKALLKETPVDILIKLYIQRKISHEEYLKMKKEIEGNNLNKPNQTNIKTTKRRLRAIPEKCSPSTGFQKVKFLKSR